MHVTVMHVTVMHVTVMHVTVMPTFLQPLQPFHHTPNRNLQKGPYPKSLHTFCMFPLTTSSV